MRSHRFAIPDTSQYQNLRFGMVKFATVLLAVLCGLCSGCQVLEPQELVPVWQREILEHLADDLHGEHWQPNVGWSPKREWDNRETRRPAEHFLRWRYTHQAWQETVRDGQDRFALRNAEMPPALDEQALLETLAKRDDLPGWNAAILLARRDPVRAAPLEPIFKRLVTQPPSYLPKKFEEDKRNTLRTISPSMQAAAAEAWCLVLAHQQDDPIEAFAAAGAALLDFDLPDEVRGELFRGIGRWVPPANVPGLDQALPPMRGNRPNPVVLRQAAMDACVLYSLWNRDTLAKDQEGEDNPWPAVLLDWQWEPDGGFETDPFVRRRFAHWLVLTGHPNARKVLESHLTDQDADVRDDALIHLGTLQTSEALETLLTHIKRPEPRVRAMAVKGLAHWGVPYLVKSLDDPSHEVRLSVAEELGRFPTAEAAVWLQKLQADPNRQVEAAALEASRTWPDALAIPVLLHGMEHASVVTRRECFRELRRRTDLEDSFPITAGPEARQLAIVELARQWNLPTQLATPKAASPPDAKVNRLRVAELQTYLLDIANPEFSEQSARYTLALRSLKESSPQDVPAIETFLLEQPDSPRMKVVYDEVLPALSPVHSAIQKLQSQELNDRRNAASNLRTLGEAQSFSRLALRRLRERLTHETDPLVWRMVLYAILPDCNPETTELVIWAANHPNAGIRQIACEFASRHKSPDFADWLLPLLHDPETLVQIAAIQAAGDCGNRLVIDGIPAPRAEESLPGLRALLADRETRVAVAAAIAMSRLGDPQGHDELIRLCLHPDPRIREQVILAMGSTGQTRFVDTLISLGWTADDVRIKQAVLKSLEALVPRNDRPAELAQRIGTDDKINIWAVWWDQRRNLREIP